MDDGVNVWVTMLNFLLDFPMPYLKVVGGSMALCVDVVPNNMVAFNPLGYNIVRKWCDIYWEVGVFQILQKMCSYTFSTRC